MTTHPRLRFVRWTLFGLWCLSFGALPLLSSCESKENRQWSANETSGGDPRLAPTLIQYYGCSACHTIPGIQGADATVGPPLTDFTDRPSIGGVAQNTPQNLVQWIQNPHSLSPNTLMPNIGVSPTDAQHIAAYLYTLH